MNTYTRTKSMSSDMSRFFVHVSHDQSNVFGISQIPIKETPVRLLIELPLNNWDDPLLQEMEAEAIDEMRDKAKLAQAVFAPPVAIITTAAEMAKQLGQVA